VVVDADRDEYHIARTVAREVLRCIRQDPELGRPQVAVLAEAAFQKHALRHPPLDREMDVAFEDLPIQRVVRVATDEEAPERSNELFERPHAGPLTNGEADGD